MRDRRATPEQFKSMRRQAQAALDAHHHFGIFVRMTRATIGEVYNHARSSEALLTLRFGTPIIVPAIRLLEVVKQRRARRMSTDELFAELTSESRKYMKTRDPVRHPKWRPERFSAKAGATIKAARKAS